MSEDVPDYLPTFYAEGWYERGAGRRVAAVMLDRERNETEMRELAQAVVVIDGTRYRCKGVERFAHAGSWRKSERVGLLVELIQ